jgi:hypothetical protein
LVNGLDDVFERAAITRKAISIGNPASASHPGEQLGQSTDTRCEIGLIDVIPITEQTLCSHQIGV